MRYKFVDIGCGHQSVSTDIFGTDVYGVLVEPIKEYLEVLPSGKNIIKVNAAISEKNGEIDFNAFIGKNPKYYSNEEITKIKNNPKLLREYNKNFLYSGQSSIKNIEKLLRVSTKIKVKSYDLKTFFEKYDITEIDYLKIDVEGYEEEILQQLLIMLEKGSIKINNQIKYEFNHLSDEKNLNKITERIKQFGFDGCIVSSPPWNTDMVLNRKMNS